MSKTPRRRPGTRTSSYGSPGRSNHDASPFYQGRLYQHLPADRKVSEQENAVPIQVLNRVFCSTSEKMDALPDQSVHLMITSPPYNVGKDYDDDLTLEEHLALLRRVWQEVKRVLVPGGRACINVANLGRKPYIPLHAFIIQDMISLDFLMRGEIIWNKASSASASTAWGSWRSASNPTLRDVHEYVLVFSKETMRRKRPPGGENTVERDDFLAWTKSVWTFPAEAARKVGHPAPFPVELPYRLIQLYTYKGEIVLDPFLGSGQTALAAIQTGRSFVGYEINPEYAALAEKRIHSSSLSSENPARE